MSKLLVIPALALGLAFSATACKKAEAPAAEAPAVRNFPITGEVQGFQADGKVILLKHDKIEGLMDAMTMGFELSDPKLGAGLKKGDKVSGNLAHSADSYIIDALKKN